MNRQPADPTLTKAHPTLAEDDLREPTKEELLEDLRIALQDTLAGKEGIPAREGLEMIRRRIHGDADHS